MLLPAGWYAFSSPRELSAKKPNRLRRFGVNWVVWKNTQGNWVVQRDACPHRSASLSLGQIKDGNLVCPFHGFRFNGDGGCSFVPELGRDAPGLKLLTLPVVERFDFLWVRWGSVASREPNWFMELESPEFTYHSSQHVWPTHFTRCVENQLDYVHLPFVHAKTIGRGVKPDRPVSWVFSDESMRVHLGATAETSNYFEFRYPNIWRLVIGSKMVQTLMFVPVDESQTILYTRAYHRFTQVPLLRQAIAWLFAKVANPMILAEDRQVVLSQAPADVCAPDLIEKLFPSDKAIIAFRKWLSGAGANPVEGHS